MATIVAAETMLVGLACLATYWPWPALLGAAVVVVKLTRSVAGLSGLGFRRI
jgi:hypothetical protein